MARLNPDLPAPQPGLSHPTSPTNQMDQLEPQSPSDRTSPTLSTSPSGRASPSEQPAPASPEPQTPVQQAWLASPSRRTIESPSSPSPSSSMHYSDLPHAFGRMTVTDRSLPLRLHTSFTPVFRPPTTGTGAQPTPSPATNTPTMTTTMMITPPTTTTTPTVLAGASSTALEPVLEIESPHSRRRQLGSPLIRTRSPPMSPLALGRSPPVSPFMQTRSPPVSPFIRSRPAAGSPLSYRTRLQSRSTPPPGSQSVGRPSPIGSLIRSPPSRSASSPVPAGPRSPDIVAVGGRFNEPFPLRRSSSVYSSGSSSSTTSSSGYNNLRSYSVPTTPTSVRSRSPSMSSLETIPDTPDAEAEALRKEQEEEAELPDRLRSRRFRPGGRFSVAEWADPIGRIRKPTWESSPSSGLSREKRKRWSVCGAERRADLDLETIWED